MVFIDMKKIHINGIFTTMECFLLGLVVGLVIDLGIRLGFSYWEKIQDQKELHEMDLSQQRFDLSCETLKDTVFLDVDDTVTCLDIRSNVSDSITKATIDSESVVNLTLTCKSTNGSSGEISFRDRSVFVRFNQGERVISCDGQGIRTDKRFVKLNLVIWSPEMISEEDTEVELLLSEREVITDVKLFDLGSVIVSSTLGDQQWKNYFYFDDGGEHALSCSMDGIQTNKRFVKFIHLPYASEKIMLDERTTNIDVKINEGEVLERVYWGFHRLCFYFTKNNQISRKFDVFFGKTETTLLYGQLNKEGFQTNNGFVKFNFIN